MKLLVKLVLIGVTVIEIEMKNKEKGINKSLLGKVRKEEVHKRIKVEEVDVFQYRPLVQKVIFKLS